MPARSARGQHLPVFRISSFIGPECEGNTHLVALDPSFASERKCAEWLEQHARSNVVILQERERRVEFHQAGREILRCGSGTLAAAHLLLRERRHTEPLQLETRAGIVRLRACGEWLGYADRPLSQVPSSRFAEWQSLLGQFLCSCRDVGGDRDYCLAEVRSEANLQALRIDSEALARFSQRALIVTAPSDEPGYDYVLRYFAPQYGNEEDGATGSANVQLGPFWQEKTGKSRLRGRQLSSSGGDFLLQADGPEVWVFGRTRDLDSHWTSYEYSDSVDAPP